MSGPTIELPQDWRTPYDLGWSVIPVEPRGKHPLGPWKPYQSEQASLATVKQWAARQSNIGIVTGTVSRLIVLDLDSREAVEAAKRRHSRIAVAGGGIRPDAVTVQSMLDLLLQLRERRSPEGWELYDLVESGLTQAEAAERLGITPQAASKRAIAAGVRIDTAAREGIAQLLALADEASGHESDTDAGSAAGAEEDA